MSNFIIVGNQAINLDHVTDVLFIEKSEGFDNPEHKEYKHPDNHDSIICLTMTSIEVEPIESRASSFSGVASASRELRFTGETAEKIWQYFVFRNINILTFTL
jgi:hypothetical protein